jgi:putative sterol carrier protein
MARELREQVATDLDLDLDLDHPSGPSIDVTRLYRLWEANHWSATALDFSRDVVDWRETFTPSQRAAAQWNYALFLHGEEAVARTLAPFVAAMPTEEQRVFITTQIVDEARHHVFFSRFMREVLGGGSDMASTLDTYRPELTIGFRRVFGELDRLTDRLRRHPRNRALLAQCITLYHLVIEGGLAHPGQQLIRGYVEDLGVLPGFAEGIAHVSRDESRHMAFGVQVLSELLAAEPAARDAVIHTLNRVLPWMITLFYSPTLGDAAVEVFGVEMADVYAVGLRSLQTKLVRAGIDPSEVAALVKMGIERTPREQAERALTLLHAGVFGDVAELRVDDAILALLFETLERVVNMRPAPNLTGAIQWDFADADPWYLTVEGSRAVVRPGRAALAVVTITCRVEAWARIAGEKLNPLWALATGQIKLRGDRAALLKLPSILGTA